MTTTTPAQVVQMTVLGSQTMRDAWHLYRDAFTDLARLAAQRHLMTRAELAQVCTDERIVKYVAIDGAGVLRGLSVMTNDLDAWPLISPPYFEHHWPTLYEQRRIWYLGFACVTDPGTVAAGAVFAKLIEQMWQVPSGNRGMVWMDFCNLRAAALVPGIRNVVRRLGRPHTFRPYDAQQFWAFDFTREGDPR
jgi:hypothetical protein